jgi:hypothetical protein
VSIASELLADPSLFFLDEPTSGLDPGLEKRMMYTLRYLRGLGRTVVLVTHATANITQCDLVAFLADGRLVYYGPPAGALQMFGATGGDFADIYTRLHGPASADQIEFGGELARSTPCGASTTPAGKPPTMAELWEMRFRDSEYYRTYVYERTKPAGRRADTEPITTRRPRGDDRPGPLPLHPRRRTPGGRGQTPGAATHVAGAPVRHPDAPLHPPAGGRPQEPAHLLMQAPIIGVVILLAARANALQSPDVQQRPPGAVPARGDRGVVRRAQLGPRGHEGGEDLSPRAPRQPPHRALPRLEGRSARGLCMIQSSCCSP